MQNFPSASSSVVPGIVKMDANKNYSLLDDPQNVFPSPQYVRNVMGSPDGNTLFILTSTGDVYSWDTLNYYQLVYSNSSLQSPLLVDSSNNVYLLGANITYTRQEGYTNSYFLIFLNASESYQRIPSPFHPSSPSLLIPSLPIYFPSSPYSFPLSPSISLEPHFFFLQQNLESPKPFQFLLEIVFSKFRKETSCKLNS